ncbi:MAG: hypothetical protein ACRYHQ_19145 [Janthinobacterium lividum]
MTLRTNRAELYRRQALVRRCFQVWPHRDMPIDMLMVLVNGSVIVHLRPVEAADFALVVAQVRYRQASQWMATV